MSPDTKKKGGFRHTIQVEYGESDSQSPRDQHDPVVHRDPLDDDAARQHSQPYKGRRQYDHGDGDGQDRAAAAHEGPMDVIIASRHRARL